MIPLRDTARSRSTPLVTWALIAINVLVFLFEVSLSPSQLTEFTHTYGLVPVRLLANPVPSELLTIVTSTFLHGGWWHLIGNMWMLRIFGDNVEDHLGHFGYLLFYLICGAVAGVAHMAANQLSPLPTVGASGAISGVMGAYVLFFPQARVLALSPWAFLPRVIEVPALIFIGIWFVSQLFNGVFSLEGAGAVDTYGGIAWWAHIGGFLAGLLLVGLFGRKRYYSEEHWPL
jgi:membrane associated rhomboid family serine protease